MNMVSKFQQEIHSIELEPRFLTLPFDDLPTTGFFIPAITTDRSKKQPNRLILQ
jgi:hypothetical protein